MNIDLFSGMTIPKAWRHVKSYNDFGSTAGISFYEDVLKEKVRLGLGNSITIDRNIRISLNGEEVCKLTEEVLGPKSVLLDMTLSLFM